MTSTNDTTSSFGGNVSRGGVNVTGYVRLIVPLGSPPKRLDCIRLYEMELQRLRQELTLMKMGAE